MKKGFTLIEVVASLVILGIALAAILGMFTIGTRAGSLNEERTIAYSLLQRKMEEVRARDYENIIEDTTTTDTYYSKYTLTTYVPPREDLDLDEDQQLKQIEISIQWTDAYGSTKTETIATKVTNVERDEEEQTSGPGQGWGWGRSGQGQSRGRWRR